MQTDILSLLQQIFGLLDLIINVIRNFLNLV